MSYSSQFLELLDRVVRLPAAGVEVDGELDVAVAAMAALVRQGEVTVIADATTPTCNGAVLEGAVREPGGVVSALRTRGLERMFVARDAAHRELRLVARALAGLATGAQEGAELTLRTVRFGRAASDRGRGRAPQPIVPMDWAAPGLADTDPFEPSLREPMPTAGVRAVVPEVMVAGSEQVGIAAFPREVSPMINTPILLRAIVEQDRREQPVEALQASLRAASRLPAEQRTPELGLILEELAHRAEQALRDDQPTVVRDVLLAILRAEADEAHPEARVAYQLMRRRLLTSPYLHAVARQLPRSPGHRKDLLRILREAGEEGADVVISHLTTSNSSSDRRAYHSALVRLNAGEVSLLHMLEDRRWYVVRNAAELLGEMEVAAADRGLARLLRHDDERVRRAALGALGRVGTARALHAVQEALAAPDPALRVQAAGVLAGTDWPYTATALGRRLREEPDDEVRLALVAALGRLGNDQAIKLLEELANPPLRARVLRRRVTLRNAAIEALAVARAPRPLASDPPAGGGAGGLD